MVGKVIPIKNERAHHLSRLMIVALVEAAVKQHQGIPFGPADIKGSFTALLNRGLIIITEGELTSKHSVQYLWRVTSEGLGILRNMGVDVDS